MKTINKVLEMLSNGDVDSGLRNAITVDFADELRASVNYYEFLRDLYIKSSEAHEQIHKMCRQGATLEDIQKVARQNIRIEGV